MSIPSLLAPFTAQWLPVYYDPNFYRGWINTDPHSQRIRWWQAMLNPSYSNNLGDKWLRTEQTDTSLNYRALVMPPEVTKQFMPYGQFQVGDQIVVTMTDEIPIGPEDWIVPIGQMDVGLAEYPDTQTTIQNEALKRGSYQTAGVGTVSSSGTAVTGSGTSFLSLFSEGDLFSSAGQMIPVASVSSNTSLTLESAPSTALLNNAYSLASEQLLWQPAARIESIQDANKTYVQDTDYTLSTDQATVLWTSPTNQPAPGATYTIRYRSFLKYIVLNDLVLTGQVVAGTPSCQAVLARRYQADSYRTGV
jgi:uncharacterized protein DUF4815